MRTKFVIILLCLVAFGCGNGGSAGSFASCVVGWWHDPTPRACACPGAPECAAPDCEGWAVLGLTADGLYYSGIVRASQSLGSATPIGSLSTGTYVVEPGLIRITPTDAPTFSVETTCEAQRMIFGGLIQVRASQWLAAVLTGLTQQ